MTRELLTWGTFFLPESYCRAGLNRVEPSGCPSPSLRETLFDLCKLASLSYRGQISPDGRGLRPLLEKLGPEMQRLAAERTSLVEVLRAQGLVYIRFATHTPELYRIATMGEWRS